MFDSCGDVEVQEGQAGINVGSLRIRTADGTDGCQVKPRLGPCFPVSRKLEATAGSRNQSEKSVGKFSSCPGRLFPFRLFIYVYMSVNWLVTNGLSDSALFPYRDEIVLA